MPVSGTTTVQAGGTTITGKSMFPANCLITFASGWLGEYSEGSDVFIVSECLSGGYRAGHALKRFNQLAVYVIQSVR